MAIVLGLLAAAFYGSADFCGGFAAKRNGMFAVAVTSQGAGFVLLLAVIPLLHGQFTARAALYGALSGICGGLAIVLLYHALSIGKMGVVSPITAVLAAAFPVVVGMMRGERLSPAHLVGIGLALVAVVCISLSTEPDGRFEFSTEGVREALVCGLLLGGFYVLLALGGKTSGLYPLLFARLASVLALFVIAATMRHAIIPAASLGIVVLAGALDMTANILYVLAAYAGYLSIAAVLTSLYPASTVFLARFVLGERLATIQKIGVVLALAGVALIAT
jgi:uncharacterized membrane protein